MARVEKTVFISYRRKDISWALAVYQYLTSHKYDVFFDYTSLSGGDFEQVIVSNIKARAHFVLILTPTALDRCNEPGDWLRREIETAVDEKRNIIPLFFDGFNFSLPAVAEKLTGKIAAINRYNGLDIPAGYFLEAMQRLSNRYLDVPLNAVIHPVSTEVRKAVKEEEIAVNEALAQKWEDIKELFKPAEEKTVQPSATQNPTATELVSPPNSSTKGRFQGAGSRQLVIGAGLLLIVAIAGINAFLHNGNELTTPTMTSQLVPSTASVSPSMTSPLNTGTVDISPSYIPTEEPTITPSPTLGIGSFMISPKDGMILVYVPAGEFTMGLDNDEDDNPAHIVNLDSFWIDKTEVTNAMYAQCDEEGVCDPPWTNQAGTRSTYYGNHEYDNFPVVYVSWIDAKTYCEWAGRQLPTEAQWEKAARGTDGRVYPWGSGAPTVDLSNYGGLVGNTTAVDDYLGGASPYGALNMAGNVWEWVVDFYDPSYYNRSRSLNPSGPDAGDNRVMRGGSWKDYESTIQAVHRYGNYPLDTSSFIGFRCAVSE